MSNSQSTGADKNIVDRTKRGSHSSRALKDVRYRLNSFQPNVQRFERELLQTFARNQINVIYLFPALIISVGAVSVLWLGYLLAIGWISMMMLAYGVFLKLCRELSTVELIDIDSDYWHRRFKRTIPVVGLGWAVLFVPVQFESVSLSNQVVQFSIFLCVMAFTTITSYTIRFAASMIVVPAVLLLGIRFSINLDPVSLTMAAVLVSAQAFFSVFGNRLYFNLRTNLKNQAEKDQLIAELETASSISEEARRRAEEANLAKSRFFGDHEP